ncbi:MAG: glycoside hydrolase family 88 protein [Spirochaetes bacterium]|nr:glycoside hydrolase family 88 protein [Spirochaetota bacterium]
MIHIDPKLTPASLKAPLARFFKVSGEKILLLDRVWDPAQGTPVFTVKGRYTARGWTEWTQGFLYGNAILQFEGTGDRRFLEMGRQNTVRRMAPHVSHTGVHDHGFNNVSTYGNLLRLMKEKRLPANPWEKAFYEMALKASSAVQAARFTELPGGLGYIRSFNGPHSLFADTIRSLRVLALGHRLGHVLMGERDRKINLLARLLQHAETTARFNVYFGKGRDAYDVRGRVAHESIFNVEDGAYRCPSTQQGYTPFSTWTRGLAWILLGYAEEIEFIKTVPEAEILAALAASPKPLFRSKKEVVARFEAAARAVADFTLEQTPVCGVPYWDTGAPNLHKLGAYLSRPADPFNEHEPVDSSAAAISAQGLLRLGRHLMKSGDPKAGARYFGAGLTTARTLLGEPYLSIAKDHQGMLLHSVYHRPNGWDWIPPGQKVPCGESSLWGDYHAMELAVYLKRLSEGKPEPFFYNI